MSMIKYQFRMPYSIFLEDTRRLIAATSFSFKDHAHVRVRRMVESMVNRYRLVHQALICCARAKRHLYRSC
jgi:hypothetical protein